MFFFISEVKIPLQMSKFPGNQVPECPIFFQAWYQNYQLFWKIIWSSWIEANSLWKFKNGIQILVGPAFHELLIETCKTLFVYNQ